MHPLPPALVFHTRELLLDGRCPACAESLPPVVLFRGHNCPHCAESPANFKLDGSMVVAEVEGRSKKSVFIVAGIVAVAHLILGWMPLTGAVSLVVAAIWIRVGLINPATKVLNPTRAMLTRWTARLIVAVLLAVSVIFSEVLTLIGPFGLPIKAILGGAEVVIAATGVMAYVNWQVRREAKGTPVEPWEWAILVFALVLLGIAAAGIAIAAIFVASALTKLAEGLVG